MKHAIAWSIVACIAAMAGSVGTLPAAAQAEDSATSRDWTEVYVVLLRPGPERQAPRSEEERGRLLQAHIAYQLELQDEGTAVAAGGFDPADERLLGMTILHADSHQEAVTIAEADPAVAAGLVAVEVRTWWVLAGRLP